LAKSRELGLRPLSLPLSILVGICWLFKGRIGVHLAALIALAKACRALALGMFNRKIGTMAAELPSIDPPHNSRSLLIKCELYSDY
jgi:hypothetical protein